MTGEENVNGEKQPKKRGQRKGKPRRRGSGSVFRRPERKGGKEWVAQIILENGKTRQRYFYTQAEADEALNEMLYEQRHGTLTTGPKQKLKDFLEQWFEEVHSPTLRLSSRLRYRGVLNNHILPALGHISLQGLTAQKVQAFYASKLKEGLSTSSLHTFHKVLHGALNTAVRWNLVSRNVCDAVSLPGETSRRVVPLTPEQAQRLLAVVKGHNLEALIALTLTTGMRHGELTGLQWSDIDFDEGSLSVRRTVNYLGRYKYVENEPKTEQSRRKIMLSSFVLQLLKEHRVRQKESRLKAGTSWQDCNLVFCNRRGGFLYPNVLLRQFHKLLDEASLPRMRLHDLRHSAATILMAMKVPIKVIQELLGHSSVNITLSVYGHVLPSMQDEAVDEMERLFGKDKGDKNEKKDPG
jgi:integrase